jgi:hypothetical protein
MNEERFWRAFSVIVIALLLLALFFVSAGAARAGSFVEGGGPHPSPLASDPKAYAAFYGSFVPSACCFTSQCCWELKDDEVVDLGNDQFRVKANPDQIVRRHGYSPDGKYHRCACDLAESNGFASSWKIWPGANTRCLFTPSFGS